MKWHITPTNRVFECNATEGRCPYGEENHFDDVRDAAKESERRFFAQMIESYDKKKDKRIKITKDGVYILCPTLAKELRDMDLRSTFIKSFIASPASAIISSFYADKFLDEEQEYFVRGTLFHQTMEALTSLPSGERTKDRYDKIFEDLIENNDKYKRYRNNDEGQGDIIRQKMDIFFRGLEHLKEEGSFDYTTFEPAIITVNGVEKVGSEVFLKNDNILPRRRLHGTPDIIGYQNGELQMFDYKTGEKVPYNYGAPDPHSGDTFSYHTQQSIYLKLAQDAGVPVKKSSLLSLGGTITEKGYSFKGGVTCFDSEQDENLIKNAINDVKYVDKRIDEFLDKGGFFPFHDGDANKYHYGADWRNFFLKYKDSEKIKANQENIAKYADISELDPEYLHKKFKE